MSETFEPKLGRIGAKRGGRRVQSFLGRVLAATARAGGHRYPQAPGRAQGRFGRGGAAALNASRAQGASYRRVVVKARVVRTGPAGSLGLHLNYLRREGVSEDRAAGRLFDAAGETASGEDFAERASGDRHHFRFIVSPEDAEQLADLKAFTRDLVRQAEHDLGTRLDWVAADHWNTAHPHVHVLVRGVDADGADLVIARDYISQGLRARASRLVTVELGLRTPDERWQVLEREAGADRWTGLDRTLLQRGGADRIVDLRPSAGGGGGYDRVLVMRLRKLEALGLADPAGAGRWRTAPDAEAMLRGLGRRVDIIARLHEAMTAAKLETGAAQPLPDSEAPHGWCGRLIGRGLDDELRGNAFVVVEGVDGTVRHAPVGTLEAVADLPLGAVVEMQRPTAQGRARLWLQSDLSVEAQATAPGATWLDRQLLTGQAPDLAETGFGDAVRTALRQRVDHLVGEGLATREGQRVRFVRDLLATLRTRELAAAAQVLVAETGLEPIDLPASGSVAGLYRRRLDLASGRFAVMETEQGFALVPWRRELDRHVGQWVQGDRLPNGGVRWSLDPARGLGR